MTAVLSIAHRGYSARYPENTLIAHEQAIRAGADMLETDARLNADGDIFCVHDPDLRRLAGSALAVADASTRDLRAMVLPGGERLMMLSDLLSLAAGATPLLIDVKTPGAAMADNLLDTVAAAGAVATSWFGFRDIDQYRHARRREPRLRCVALTAGTRDIDPWVAAGADAIRVWEGDFDEAVERRLAPRTPIWITAGGRNTPDRTGDIDAFRLAGLLERPVAAVLLNDPTAMRNLHRSPAA